MALEQRGLDTNFNPRTPCGVRPYKQRKQRKGQVISIHAPLAGCDCPSSGQAPRPVISIHAPLAGCDVFAENLKKLRKISIHAPLAGCDSTISFGGKSGPYFNPRTPCGVRHIRRTLTDEQKVFQSTHPLRGATLPGLRQPPGHADFNPRTPCGVRRAKVTAYGSAKVFQSTHPLRGATCCIGMCAGCLGFQSTHPLRGATFTIVFILRYFLHFNPRTPCGVRPEAILRLNTLPSYFNPRTPCGVRQRVLHAGKAVLHFNPRTPCGVRRNLIYLLSASFTHFNPRTPCGVRLDPTFHRYKLKISIHAPLAGCDQENRRALRYLPISIHAPLAGCDAGDAAALTSCAAISIHAPLAGCDARNNRFDFSSLISIHAPLAGCDLINQMLLADPEKFQSTHPLRGATRPTITTRPS